jgi:hypothetical protein
LNSATACLSAVTRVGFFTLTPDKRNEIDKALKQGVKVLKIAAGQQSPKKEN